MLIWKQLKISALHSFYFIGDKIENSMLIHYSREQGQTEPISLNFGQK
jgi:hypothetical protein